VLFSVCFYVRGEVHLASSKIRMLECVPCGSGLLSPNSQNKLKPKKQAASLHVNPSSGKSSVPFFWAYDYFVLNYEKEMKVKYILLFYEIFPVFTFLLLVCQM
jgi:hypothetical protein